MCLVVPGYTLVLEDAGIKIDSVASDMLGKSGREMIEALIAGALPRVGWVPQVSSQERRPACKSPSLPAGRPLT
jgi:hypothetical protein